MKAEVLKNFPLIQLTIAALLIFVAVFIGHALWTFRKSARSYYEKAARIPLKESDHE